MLDKVLFGFFRALPMDDIMQPICNRFKCRRIKKEASILGVPAKRRWYHLKGDTDEHLQMSIFRLGRYCGLFLATTIPTSSHMSPDGSRTSSMQFREIA